MSIFISIQHTYQGIEAALFDKYHLLGAITDDKKRASKTIIGLLNELLSAHQLQIRDLAFLAVNQGPGPFTTLRVVIASVNGLSFAIKKPLIGIDGLDALIQENQSEQHPITLALLNAFTNDVYFALHDRTCAIYEKGCKNITQLLLELHERFSDTSFYLVGNGCLMHEQEIRAILGSRVESAQPLPENCSIRQIGIMGYEQWQKRAGISYQLSPLYLKTHFMHQ